MSAQFRPLLTLGLKTLCLCFELSCGYYDHRTVNPSPNFVTLLAVLWLSLQMELQCLVSERATKAGGEVPPDSMEAVAHGDSSEEDIYFNPCKQINLNCFSWIYSLTPV